MNVGDIFRVRVLGSESEWCVGRVAILSENERSVGLLTGDALRLESGIVTGFIPILIEDGRALLAGFDVELEVEKKK